MVRRSARGDGRVDGALLAVALLLSVVARVIPEPRSDRIAGGLRRTVLAPVLSIQERAERARRAIVSEDSLTFAADSALLKGLDAQAIARENTRLRALLGLAARVRIGFVAAEALHGPAFGEEHTMVLTAGTRAGVVPFSPVIAPEGIVGYVRSADAQTSVAIVWPHPDFRVSAMAASGSAIGIVSAHLGAGASRFLLELRGVPLRSPLPIGARIVSAGVGGTFPRGIPIGTVLAALPSDEGWARNYLVEPAVHPADIGTVLILLPEKARVDQTNVWVTPDSAAAVVRRAVAAGDTLGRGKAVGRDTSRRMR